MLFFELFPAFMTIVCLVIAVLLFARNRQARNNPTPERPITPPRPVSPGDAPERGGRRPSMSA